MKNIIDKVYEQKMNDGTVEKIVSEHFDKMLHQVLDSEMGWSGEANKLIKEKMKPLLVEAIERSDLGAMLEKITAIINEGVKNSTLDEYASTLDSIRTLFNSEKRYIKNLEGKKSVRMSEIFSAYKDYLEKDAFSKDDFDEDMFDSDDGEVYTYLEANMSVAEQEYNGFFFRKSSHIVEFSVRHANEEEIENSKADARFRLEWNYNNTALKLHTDFGSMPLSELRYAPDFFLYLWYIERNWLDVEIDTNEDSDEVLIKFPEYE